MKLNDESISSEPTDGSSVCLSLLSDSTLSLSLPDFHTENFSLSEFRRLTTIQKLYHNPNKESKEFLFSESEQKRRTQPNVIDGFDVAKSDIDHVSNQHQNKKNSAESNYKVTGNTCIGTRDNYNINRCSEFCVDADKYTADLQMQFADFLQNRLRKGEQNLDYKGNAFLLKRHGNVKDMIQYNKKNNSFDMNNLSNDRNIHGSSFVNRSNGDIPIQFEAVSCGDKGKRKTIEKEEVKARHVLGHERSILKPNSIDNRIELEEKNTKIKQLEATNEVLRQNLIIAKYKAGTLEDISDPKNYTNKDNPSLKPNEKIFKPNKIETTTANGNCRHEESKHKTEQLIRLDREIVVKEIAECHKMLEETKIQKERISEELTEEKQINSALKTYISSKETANTQERNSCKRGKDTVEDKIDENELHNLGAVNILLEKKIRRLCEEKKENKRALSECFFLKEQIRKTSTLIQALEGDNESEKKKESKSNLVKEAQHQDCNILEKREETYCKKQSDFNLHAVYHQDVFSS